MPAAIPGVGLSSLIRVPPAPPTSSCEHYKPRKFQVGQSLQRKRDGVGDGSLPSHFPRRFADGPILTDPANPGSVAVVPTEGGNANYEFAKSSGNMDFSEPTERLNGNLKLKVEIIQAMLISSVHIADIPKKIIKPGEFWTRIANNKQHFENKFQ